MLRASGSLLVSASQWLDRLRALRGEVVHRVVPAVGVAVGVDEDLGVVEQLLGLGVGRVVAHEPLGGLEAGQAGRPLARVGLAGEEHADLRAVPVRADAVHALLERAALDVGGRVEEVLQRLHLAARARDAGARVAAVGRRGDERARGRAGVDGRDDLRRGAGDGAVGALPSVTLIALPSTPTATARSRRAGDELRRDPVAALVAPGLRGEHDRPGRLRRGQAAGLVGERDEGLRARPGPAAGDRLRLALIARRQVRQVDRGDQVRELGREPVELRADLGRVLVAVEEALLVAGDVRRQVPAPASR